ncbi:MAG: ABC transporter permease [Balneolaceae bacterium]
MLKNYIKIAFRNLFKNKTYSGINIFGLSIGVACCFMILLYLTNEFSYDKFHENSDRIYRAWVHEDYGDGSIYWNTVTPLRLKDTIEENIPEAESIARIYVFNDLVKVEETSEGFSEPIQLVDPEFFTMFDFKLLKGSPESVFSQTSNVVLSPASAERFFGSSDVIGKTLLITINDQLEPFTVSGIIENYPTNSSIEYELLIPLENGRKFFSDRAYTSWFSVIAETYVQLSEESELASTKAKLIAMMQGIFGEEEWNRSNYTINLQPITDIRLNPSVPLGIAAVTDPTYLYILAGIAILVLLIACVNFMTLSISRSTSRAKEVGIRKTIGAERANLTYQFWGEALLMTIIALSFGLLISELFLPYFNHLAGTSLSLSFSRRTVVLFVGLASFISLVAGIYPAVILSGFKPVEVLKGKVNLKGDKSFFRTGMVVFQFTLSIFLIGSTLIITDQLDFMRSKDLGYQKDHVIILQVDDNADQDTGFIGLMERASNRTELLKSQLASNPNVESVSYSLYTPAQSRWISADYRDTGEKLHAFNINFIDETYPEIMNLKFLQGRSFSKEITTDASQGIIVNQAFADDHGWTDPLNAQLLSPDFIDHEIIGVVENFNYQSLRTEVQPLAMVTNPRIFFSGIDNIDISSASPRISLKIKGENIPSTLSSLESAWDNISPGEPFNITFLDQAVDSQYRQEERLSKIVTFGSTFAIIIACLGLFGLASLLVVRKTKEIGVRKVLGASSNGIVILINKEFTKLLVLSFVLAVPLTWYTMSLWLKDFAFQTEISIWTFIISGSLSLLIAWIAVGYQSYKASTINPVESLKGE